MPSSLILVDTNVLIYAYDPRDRTKQQRAEACLDRLAEAHRGAISAQIMGEFFWTATRRLDPRLSAAEAERSLVNYARSWPVFEITSSHVMEAVRVAQRYQLPYWDALIWATAKLRDVPTILSEDLPSSTLIEGIRFVNPFVSMFDLEALS